MITWQQNLGLLLAEAGLWGEEPEGAFAALVPRLIWCLGPPHEPYGPAPMLSLSEDGSGSATLTTQLVIPGGPLTTARFVLNITPDRRATLSPVSP